MSSFIIDRSEFVKAGAYLGAFTEMKANSEPILYKYLEKENRLANAEDIVEIFLKLYNCNVESVNEQYNETNATSLPEVNANDKLVIQSIKHKIYTYGAKTKIHGLLGLQKFLRSVNYQIDYDEKGIARDLINKICADILQVIYYYSDYDSTDWGEFNLPE